MLNLSKKAIRVINGSTEFCQKNLHSDQRINASTVFFAKKTVRVINGSTVKIAKKTIRVINGSTVKFAKKTCQSINGSTVVFSEKIFRVINGSTVNKTIPGINGSTVNKTIPRINGSTWFFLGRLSNENEITRTLNTEVPPSKKRLKVGNSKYP